jgi:hypothetical protein
VSLIPCSNCSVWVSEDARACPNCSAALQPASDFGDWDRACTSCGGPLPPLYSGEENPYLCLEGCLNGCPICFRAGGNGAECPHGIASAVDVEVDGFEFATLDHEWAEGGTALDLTPEQRLLLGNQFAFLDHYTDEATMMRQPRGRDLLDDILDRITTPVEQVRWTSEGMCSSSVCEYFSEEPERARAEVRHELQVFGDRLQQLERLTQSDGLQTSDEGLTDAPSTQRPGDDSVGSCGFCGRMRTLDPVTMGMALCDECHLNPNAIRAAFDAAATLRRQGDAHRGRGVDPIEPPMG